MGEKIASLKTLDYLRDRARRGNRSQFEEVLAKVPDIEPEETDRLPSDAGNPARRRTRRGRSSPRRKQGGSGD